MQERKRKRELQKAGLDDDLVDEIKELEKKVSDLSSNSQFNQINELKENLKSFNLQKDSMES